MAEGGNVISKLGCECGDTISDTTDFIPYKGAIVRDQDSERVYDGIAEDINAFINALLQGKREEWAQSYFLPGYPYAKVDNIGIVADIISRHLLEHEFTIYQCMNCGSVKIQSGLNSNLFKSFFAKEWLKGSRSILEAEGKDVESWAVD